MSATNMTTTIIGSMSAMSVMTDALTAPFRFAHPLSDRAYLLFSVSARLMRTPP